VRLLRRAGVDVVVSALTQAEAAELGLADEGQCCQNNGLEFLAFPIEDRSVPPSLDEFCALLNSLTDHLRNGKAVAVHCRAGIGRSSMIVASTLIRNGVSVDSAFTAIREARGCSVPDVLEQRQWVEKHASRFGREGK